MGQMKELWAKQAREIEKSMDEITAENGQILSVGNYIDYLLDFYEMDVLEDFYAVIVEYQDELIWNYEQEQERHDKRFKKAMAAGGLFFLDEMDSCSPELLAELCKAAHNGK